MTKAPTKTAKAAAGTSEPESKVREGILVRLKNGQWHPWTEDAIHRVTMTSGILNRYDGTTEEVQTDPYPLDVTYNGNKVYKLWKEGIWSTEEVEAAGGKIAKSFIVPEGKIVDGAPRYQQMPDGSVQQIYDVADPVIPEPMTLEQKLANLGLTREDLREILTAKPE